MTQDLEITRIVRPAHSEAAHRVTGIGGPGFDFDIDVAVSLMHSGQVEFYVWHEGKYVGVEAVVPSHVGDVVPSHPWLRTLPDGTPLDTLEHLAGSLEAV